MTENNDWLLRFTPSEWLRAGLAELGQAEAAYARGDSAAGAASCKRGAGMSLNALLQLQLNGAVATPIAWGRTYVEHLQALASDASAPASVRAAAAAVVAAKGGPAALISLRIGAGVRRPPGAAAGPRSAVLEHAHDVVAHVFALMVRAAAYEPAAASTRLATESANAASAADSSKPSWGDS